MTDYELAKTFFPGTRKELITQSVQLLETRAGEKRLKLSLIMPLVDDKLVGMPSWIGDSFDVICKEGSLLTEDKWGHKIKDMVSTIFNTDDADRSKFVVNTPLLVGFSLQRKKAGGDEDNLPDIYLHFYGYLVASQQLWNWFYEKRGNSMWVNFETTQKELPLGENKQMNLTDAEQEAQQRDADRKEAISQAHDEEFARA